MLVDDINKFVFFHVPRCGGTFVQKNLTARFPSAQEYWGFTQDGTDMSHLYLSNFTKHTGKSLDSIEDYYKFCIVRNPYSRLFSAYLARGLWVHNDNSFTGKWDLSKKIAFKDFVKKYVHEEKVMSKRMIWFRPAHTFSYANIGSSMVQKVNFFRYEDMQLSLETIKDNLLAPDLIFKEVDESVSTDSLKYIDKYDTETISRINSVYKEDFNLLGYDAIQC